MLNDLQDLLKQLHVLGTVQLPDGTFLVKLPKRDLVPQQQEDPAAATAAAATAASAAAAAAAVAADSDDDDDEYPPLPLSPLPPRPRGSSGQHTPRAGSNPGSPDPQPQMRSSGSSPGSPDPRTMKSSSSFGRLARGHKVGPDDSGGAGGSSGQQLEGLQRVRQARTSSVNTTASADVVAGITGRRGGQQGVLDVIKSVHGVGDEEGDAGGAEASGSNTDAHRWVGDRLRRVRQQLWQIANFNCSGWLQGCYRAGYD